MEEDLRKLAINLSVCPFPEYLNEVLRAKWVFPGDSLNGITKKFYALVVLSNFTREIVIWTNNLLQSLSTDPLTFKKFLLQIKRATEFAADVTQNSMQMCTQAQAANVLVRRNL